MQNSDLARYKNILMENPGLFPSSHGLIGASDAIARVVSLIDTYAGLDATVLITGPTGTGKEMAARAIHDYGPKRIMPFVKVNSVALPMELIESELYGYDRGAFTGANRNKKGKFELANEGTLFLDEIGDMPIQAQAKLLHVLQDGQAERLGGTRPIEFNTRVIAATNQRLEVLVSQGRFREDLYYRLHVLPLAMPSLSEMPEDVPVLAHFYHTFYCEKYGREQSLETPHVFQVLSKHNWPGNVRQLEHAMQLLAVMHKGIVTDELLQNYMHQNVGNNGRLYTAGGAADQATSKQEVDLGLYQGIQAPAPATPVSKTQKVYTPPEISTDLKAIVKKAVREAEKGVIKQVLEDVRWNRMEAARRLKISYKALLYKIQEAGL